jgi:hypothetical protein
MGRYDSHKNPFQYRINSWVDKKINDHLQRVSKSIPCHVTKVDKDFVTVAFETHDKTLTPPTVKIPQSFSPYAREPTQVGDKGYAVPADYYLGGISGDAGGATNYYPRANLTTLSFQPISQKANPSRDYDQYTITGGPNGVQIIQNASKPASSSNGGTNGGTAPVPQVTRQARVNRLVPGYGFSIPVPMTTASSSSGPSGPATASGSSDQPKTTLTIDNNGKMTIDGTNKYRTTVDSQGKKVTVEAPADGKSFIYIGGPGKNSSLYSPVSTVAGPAVNTMAKYVATDES